MEKEVEVFIMSGAGNLFAVVDGYADNTVADRIRPHVIDICSGRYEGIMPTEGLMVLQAHDLHDFECLFHNPDGSTGMMCGNGSRAIVRFAQATGRISSDKNIRFLMAGNIYEAFFAGNDIRVLFPPPVSVITDESLEIEAGKKIPAAIIDVNSDHIVLDADDLGMDIFDADISGPGKKIRYDERFEPRGINVNFYKRLNENTLKLRTYERGVEKETGACGTGSISTALAFSHGSKTPLPVHIITSSNQRVTIGRQDGKISLTGPAEILYRKALNIPTEQ